MFFSYPLTQIFFSPLRLLATSRGFLDAVKIIHARDPTSIFNTSAEGFTSLHIACMNGHAKVAHFLIDAGFNKEEKMTFDPYGRVPIFYAGQWARKGDKEMRAIEEKLMVF